MQAKDTCIFTPSSSHSYFGASERGGGWGTLLSPTVISADFLVPHASVSPPWSVGARAEMFIEQSEGFRRGRSEIWAAVQPLTCHTQSLRLFRLLVQTWQRFTHTRCVHTALQEPSGKPVMLTASPPQKIFRDVAEGFSFFYYYFWEAPTTLPRCNRNLPAGGATVSHMYMHGLLYGLCWVVHGTRPACCLQFSWL